MRCAVHLSLHYCSSSSQFLIHHQTLPVYVGWRANFRDLVYDLLPSIAEDFHIMLRPDEPGWTIILGRIDGKDERDEVASWLNQPGHRLTPFRPPHRRNSNEKAAAMK